LDTLTINVMPFPNFTHLHTLGQQYRTLHNYMKGIWDLNFFFNGNKVSNLYSLKNIEVATKPKIKQGRKKLGHDLKF